LRKLAWNTGLGQAYFEAKGSDQADEDRNNPIPFDEEPEVQQDEAYNDIAQWILSQLE